MYFNAPYNWFALRSLDIFTQESFWTSWWAYSMRTSSGGRLWHTISPVLPASLCQPAGLYRGIECWRFNILTTQQVLHSVVRNLRYILYTGYMSLSNCEKFACFRLLCEKKRALKTTLFEQMLLFLEAFGKKNITMEQSSHKTISFWYMMNKALFAFYSVWVGVSLLGVGIT